MFTRLAANWRTLRAIGPWARPHRRVLAWTMLATVGVVLLRLAFPWPLRGVLEIASGTAGTAGHHDRSIAQLVPAGIDGVLAFGVAYLVVSICVGIAELVQRVRAKRYTTRVVNDLRGSALIGAVRSQRPQRTGELIARIIGDAARIREGLSGVLVHLTQNSLLFAGMAVLLLIVSPSLGVLLIGAGLLAVLIGIFASSLTTDVATRHREKEGSFAHQIQHSIDHGEVHHKSERTNAQSGKNDVEATRLIGATCLL
ncbi:MAG: ABC transporter transmembrane domain-containing protein, partial [Planctomycetota bacterium]